MTETETEAIDALNEHPKNSDFYGEIGDVTEIVTHMEDRGFDETEAIEIVRESVNGWPQNRIVSGHRRLAAAKEVGFDEVPIRTVTFDNEDEELDYLLQKNKYRQKTDAMLIREGYDYECRHGDDIDGRTREVVANFIGKSGEWYRKGKRVMLAAEGGVWGDESLDGEPHDIAKSEWERIQNGDSSVTGAYRLIKRANNSTDSEPDERANNSTDEPEIILRPSHHRDKKRRRRVAASQRRDSIPPNFSAFNQTLSTLHHTQLGRTTEPEYLIYPTTR